MNSKTLVVGAACLVLGGVIGIFVERSRPAKSGMSSAVPVLKPKQTEPVTARNLEEELAKLFTETNAPGPRAGFDSFFTRQSEFVARLAPDAMPAAAQAAMARASSRQGNLLAAIFPRWVAADLEGARRFALEQTGPARKTVIGLFLNAWQQQSPDAMTLWLDQISDADVFAVGLPLLVQRFSATDPTRAHAYWLKLPADQRRMWVSTLFRGWAEKDPATAVSNLTQIAAPEYETRSLMQTALQNWAGRDAAAVAGYLRQMPDGTRRREFIQSVTPALGRTQPKAGVELIQSLPAGDDRQSLLGSLVNAWASQDTRAAFQWARDLPESGDRQVALTATLDKLGEADPAALREFILREPANTVVVNRVSTLARQIAGTNAAAVLEWARRLPPGTTRDTVLGQGILALESLEPTNAVALAGQLPAGETRRSTLRGIYSRWARQDPKAAAVTTAGLPPSDRADALESVAQHWAASEPEAAIQWVLSLEASADRRRAERAVVNALEQEQPAKAAAFVAMLPDSEHSATLLESALGRWAGLDLNAAAGWLEQKPDGLRRRAGYRKLAQVALRTDLQRATAFALQTSPDDGYNSVREEVARRWAESDPEAATKWLLTNGSSGTRLSYAFNSAFSRWAQKTPQTALAFITSLPKESPVFTGTQTLADFLRTPLYDWSRQDPAAAMNWLGSNATTQARTSLHYSILRQWADRDPMGMLAWLHDQPAGEFHDKYAASGLAGLAFERPELAAQRVDLITDEKQRHTTMQSIYSSWRRRDPTAAADWLKTNSLPDAVKDRLKNRNTR